MSDEFIQNLNPFIMPQSPLYQAAVKLAAKEQVLAAQKAAEPTLFFNVSQINTLLNRFGAKNWTFDQIRNFPLSQLKPNERQFIQYLRLHPEIFQQLSRLDKKPGLSAQDIKIAAQLAGDALILSSEDLEYLKELPKTTIPTNLPPESEHHVQANDIMNFLNRLAPNGMTFSELHEFKPPVPLNQQDEEIWRLLQSRSVQKILYNLTQVTQGALTAEVMRTLMSLIWNPAILGTAPIVFLKSPEFDEEEEEEVHEVDETPEVDADEESTQKRFRLRTKIKWRANQLKKLLHNINPETDHVTLDELRRYRPRNEEERPIVSLLKQSTVFELLAGQDHDAHDLSFTDIELALIERTLVLSDPYITLVILP